MFICKATSSARALGALSKHLGPCHTNHAPGKEEKDKLRATFDALRVRQKRIEL